MKKIYVCHTQYHVLITVLKVLKDTNTENEIILYATIQEVEEIKKRLEAIKLFEKVYIFKENDRVLKPIGENTKNQIEFRKS